MKLIPVIVSAILLVGVILSGCERSPEAKKSRYMAAGRQYLQQKDYARAILQFRNAAQLTPKDPEIYYQLGMAYANAQDYTTAVASFQRVLALKPDHLGAQLGIA